jgi:addiction module RelE/StbE family toxin
MWEILEHRRVSRQLERIPIEILQRYEVWKEIVTVSGPQGLCQIRGFNDESLRGEWRGHRSSRLNQQYRVIYKIEKQRVLVEVVSVTAHDYRRR